MILHIKNMVCDRCIMVVRQQLQHLNYCIKSIRLGQVEIHTDADENGLLEIASAVRLLGFELIDSEKQKIVEQIKNAIVTHIHHADLTNNHINFSALLSDKLSRDYAYLSRLFSEYEDSTIEKFIIQQKVERVKELLEYGQLNLNEIAYIMGYSSSAHLSAQFKNTTGMTPSQYRTANSPRRSIDSI